MQADMLKLTARIFREPVNKKVRSDCLGTYEKDVNSSNLKEVEEKDKRSISGLSLSYRSCCDRTSCRQGFRD